MRWIALFVLIMMISLSVMRYGGPLITFLLSDQSYRAMRATPPWHYIGYLLGGTAMVAALISLIKGRVTRTALLVGFAASLIIALLYDLPLDDLQLPPNGDV